MTRLPTGTVTFLFTDIERSTALVRQLRDHYGEVLAKHQALLRGAVEAAGGDEISTQGDSFFAVFRTPKEAVVAAAAAQRQLAGHDWPEGVQLSVRMGVHTGEASVVGDTYVGLAVHRAARICAAAHGGQVLVSPTTHALFEDEEDQASGLTLRDLGQRRLKDFDRPVRIYQLVGPGLADDFPPLRTLPEETTLEERVSAAQTQALSAAPGGAPGTAPWHEAPERPKVRVLIVDDQALVRAGFRMILDAEKDMDVVGEAADGLEALAAVRNLRPDVVLMDVRMPGLDGIEATRRLLSEDGADTRVVMLTTFDMDEYLYEALRAGASGFLLKDVPPEQLVAGIAAVASGDALLAPTVTRRVIEAFVRRPPDSARPAAPQLADLTDREVEVLKLIARGLSNAEIASELYVSDTTVKTHVARILMKLEVRDRVQAVVYAYESGLVQPGASG